MLVYPPMEGRPMRVVAQRLGASGQYAANPPTFQGRILLRSVGLWLWVDPAESQVVLEHQVTGERFLTSKQEEAGRRAAERRAEEERQHAEEERQRAEEERQRAEEERQRAEEAERRAEEAEARGRAKSLLEILQARGFSLDQDARNRILGCRDPLQLEQWTQRAFQLEELGQLWNDR